MSLAYIPANDRIVVIDTDEPDPTLAVLYTIHLSYYKWTTPQTATIDGALAISTNPTSTGKVYVVGNSFNPLASDPLMGRDQFAWLAILDTDVHPVSPPGILVALPISVVYSVLVSPDEKTLYVSGDNAFTFPETGILDIASTSNILIYDLTSYTLSPPQLTQTSDVGQWNTSAPTEAFPPSGTGMCPPSGSPVAMVAHPTIPELIFASLYHGGGAGSVLAADESNLGEWLATDLVKSQQSSSDDIRFGTFVFDGILVNGYFDIPHDPLFHECTMFTTYACFGPGGLDITSTGIVWVPGTGDNGNCIQYAGYGWEFNFAVGAFDTASNSWVRFYDLAPGRQNDSSPGPPLNVALPPNNSVLYIAFPETQRVGIMRLAPSGLPAHGTGGFTIQFPLTYVKNIASAVSGLQVTPDGAWLVAVDSTGQSPSAHIIETSSQSVVRDILLNKPMDAGAGFLGKFIKSVAPPPNKYLTKTETDNFKYVGELYPHAPYGGDPWMQFINTGDGETVGDQKAFISERPQVVGQAAPLSDPGAGRGGKGSPGSSSA
jgi:hypothetical protein